MAVQIALPPPPPTMTKQNYAYIFNLINLINLKKLLPTEALKRVWVSKIFGYLKLDLNPGTQNNHSGKVSSCTPVDRQPRK